MFFLITMAQMVIKITGMVRTGLVTFVFKVQVNK